VPYQAIIAEREAAAGQVGSGCAAGGSSPRRWPPRSRESPHKWACTAPSCGTTLTRGQTDAADRQTVRVGQCW